VTNKSFLFYTITPLFLISLVHTTVHAVPVPTPPSLTSASYILIDFNTNKIIAEKDSHAKRAPASLTKLMTAYTVYREIDTGDLSLTDMVNISEKAWKTGGSRSFIEVNKNIPVEILLKGMIIQSGNDASVALAEHIAGDEATFAQLMNNYAKQLGMNNSHFLNASGLPTEEHYSTAYDLAIVSRAIISEYPEFYRWYSMKSFTYNDIPQHNRNSLLSSDKTVDGLKTGYTKKAGYCLAASAKKSGMRLISVVLGSKSKKLRGSETNTLLRYGFRFYETHKLFRAGQTLYNSRIWQGQSERIATGVSEDVYITILRKQYKNLKASATLDATLLAPINKGTGMGTVDIKLEDQDIKQIPLVALENVSKGSVWQQVLDSFKLWFK
jgi:serine-type D-Ala-D-Ala carboxypeptidase (penicillin-binding protein 5/6)